MVVWHMKKKAKRLAVLTTAIVFLLLGLAGLALPFLQGFLFLAIGLLLLSLCYPVIREWAEAHTRPYPKIHSAVEKVRAWIENKIGEI